jgi:hypothetical protein
LEARLAEGGISAGGLEEIAAVTALLDKESRSWFSVTASATEDLFPGRSNEEISTLERVRAVCDYVKRHVMPLTSRDRHKVFIEYQMGPNFDTCAVSAALMALFHDHDVVVVSPKLKQKVAVGGRTFGSFVPRYARLYSANKAHSLHTAREIEKIFPVQLPKNNGEAGHVADSLLQVIAYQRSQ